MNFSLELSISVSLEIIIKIIVKVRIIILIKVCIGRSNRVLLLPTQQTETFRLRFYNWFLACSDNTIVRLIITLIPAIVFSLLRIVLEINPLIVLETGITLFNVVFLEFDLHGGLVGFELLVTQLVQISCLVVESAEIDFLTWCLFPLFDA